MAPQSSAYKHWCFTLNNYDEESREGIIKTFRDGYAIYWIVGKEVGEQGTPHLQGYFILRKRERFTSIKDRLHSGLHLENAHGSARQNREYCSKCGDFEEGGVIPEGSRECSRKAFQDHRSDIAREFATDLTNREGAGGSRAGLVQFAADRPGDYYFSGHNLLRNWLVIQPPIDRPDISCSWYYGPPGTGKSRAAHDTLPNAFIKEPRTKWWNGYMLEKEVIIDDFGPNGIDINHLLRWFDRYKCVVESKGGMLPLHACTFIVTSNFHPEDLFGMGDWKSPQLPALMRRLTCTQFQEA